MKIFNFAATLLVSLALLAPMAWGCNQEKPHQKNKRCLDKCTKSAPGKKDWIDLKCHRECMG